MPTKESKPKKNGSTARSSALKTTRTPPAVQPGDDQIRVRAYEIFLERGYHGDPMEDWLRAERELIERTTVLATPPIARRRVPAAKAPVVKVPVAPVAKAPVAKAPVASRSQRTRVN